MIERNLFTQQAGGGGVPNKKIHAAHFAIRLERVCAASLLLSMMSQVNGYIAMPSYNALLAGWGLFTVNLFYLKLCTKSQLILLEKINSMFF